jgi:heme/copper-type cytochrome/quinol oxidase subunit 2
MVLLKFSKILFRILWSFVGACIGAIVVKTRNGASLALLSTSGDYAAKAGYVIALWIIVLLIGLVFGVVASISINFYLKYRLSSNS